MFEGSGSKAFTWVRKCATGRCQHFKVRAVPRGLTVGASAEKGRAWVHSGSFGSALINQLGHCACRAAFRLKVGRSAPLCASTSRVEARKSAPPTTTASAYKSDSLDLPRNPPAPCGRKRIRFCSTQRNEHHKHVFWVEAHEGVNDARPRAFFSKLKNPSRKR